MPTINELMEGKKPGEIKICRPFQNPTCIYWSPYFKDGHGLWHGLNSSNENSFYCGHSFDDWKRHEEPKPKVKRWLWAYKNGSGGWDIDAEYMTEERASENHLDPKKLPWSEMEFDDE